MWKTVKQWFSRVFTRENAKKVGTEAKNAVVETASDTLNQFVNDPANQAAAKEAISAIAQSGLENNKALNGAVAILRDRGIAAGKSAANTLLRTLVQIVYATIKLG